MEVSAVSISKYAPKLYENDQTRYAMTSAIQRTLLRDHLCFCEELTDRTDGRFLSRILIGYLQFQRDRDVAAFENSITAAFDSPCKRIGGEQRFRFNRGLAELVNSFSFSREEHFDKRVLVEALLAGYCRLPYAEREQCYFYEQYQTIQECICEHTELLLSVKSAVGEIRKFQYKPFCLQTDENSLLSYLAGFSHEIGSAKPYGIFSVRLQRILSAVNTKEDGTLGADKVALIRKRIGELGIAYINFDQTEPIRVALTQQGYNKFTKILLHQRPLPSAPLELCEGDYPYLLTFQCSQIQIRNYFFSFGADAKILSPDSLREEFAREYHKAAVLYTLPKGC